MDLNWVKYSLGAFNGSGYADRSSGKDFLESYIMYNKWKKRPKAVKLANEFYDTLLPIAENLSKKPRPTELLPKRYAEFQLFCNPLSQVTLF